MKRLLIVDDSPFFRRLLKEELITNSMYKKEYHDLQIFEAENKRSALEKLQTQTFDLILLDIVMQENEMEGVQILKEIHDHYPELKVIIISSVGQQFVTKKCQELGAKGYISKPFAANELYLTIRKVLSED